MPAERPVPPPFETPDLERSLDRYLMWGLFFMIVLTNCSGCHGKNATGGSGPVLNSKQFLKTTTDDQIRGLVSGGVPGTEMPAWSLSFGGTLTDEQVLQITTYLRSLEPTAPSVPNWRAGRS
jgi:mono/diheme cytochrome c family protein